MTQKTQDARTQVLKPALLAILSGILLALSFPGIEAAWLAWIAFVPLFFALKQKSKPRVFFLAYLSGMVFWGLTVYWLVHVTLLGTVLLVLYLSSFFGLFGLMMSWYASVSGRKTAPYGFLLFVPGAWVILEYARSHLLTGFPWALAGYSQYRALAVIQIASVAGPWGVSFLVLFVNAAAYWLFGRTVVKPDRRLAEKAKIAIVLGAVMVLTLGYGYFRLSRPASCGSQPPLKISIIQANIPQELKWNPAAQGLIIQRYLEMSGQALAQRPHLIVWPEAAVPVVVEADSRIFRRLADFAESNKSALLAGAVTRREEIFYNSALLFLPGESGVQQYDKLHLVPFGEYIPLKKFLPFLETVVPIGDIAAGKGPVILDAAPRGGLSGADRGLFGVLICFEDVFPEISRAFVRAGAHFLVNITNDAWYKKTPAARQHFQASVFRAVENARYLVRSANTGVSGFISPTGKILSLVQDAQGCDILIPGILTEELKIPTGARTLYTRFGDWFILACIGTCMCVILWERRKKAAVKL